MGLFTNPVVLNNGTARSFEYVGQTLDQKAMVGNYIESAAGAEIASKLVSRHEISTKTYQRSLLQRTVMCANTAGILKPITVNLSAAYDKLHESADVALELRLMAAVLAATNFDANFIKKLI
jgi:hypothetical protein